MSIRSGMYDGHLYVTSRSVCHAHRTQRPNRQYPYATLFTTISMRAAVWRAHCLQHRWRCGGAAQAGSMASSSMTNVGHHPCVLGAAVRARSHKPQATLPVVRACKPKWRTAPSLAPLQHATFTFLKDEMISSLIT
jgi:hypothetical protein